MGAVINLKREPNRYKGVEVDKTLVEGLKELRHNVENQGQPKIMLVGDTYKTRGLTEVRSIRYNGWDFGYQVKPTPDPTIFVRRIFMKRQGEKILDIPDKERERIMGAIFEAMIDTVADIPSFKLIADDCILIEQQFMVAFMHEFNPNIVTPGKK